MVVIPNSKIKLLKTPFEMNDGNQLTFTNTTTQYNYFNSLPKLESDDFTYIRKDNVIRYDGAFDDLIGFNYCMYQNTSYSNKWFYAYITDIKYINDDVTFITIETDVFQSWQFDINIKRSFVVREHTNDDTIGSNTIPENLELGEYVCNGQKQYDRWNFEEFCYVIGVTEFIETLDWNSNTGVPQGIKYIAFASNLDLQKYIDKYASGNKLDAVICCFVLPKVLFTNFKASSFNDIGYISTEANVNFTETITITKPNKLSLTYEVKNNKLFTFPFSFIQATNNCGDVVNYHYELFDMFSENPSINFKVYNCIVPSGSIRLVPVNYKRLNDNNDEGLTYGKLPIGSFTGDVYTNWLTQNGVNILTNSVGNTLNLVGGFLETGANPVGGALRVSSSLNNIVSSIGQVYQHSLIPDTINGEINSVDSIFKSIQNEVIFKHITLKDEYLKICDDFFSMYGYKTNKLKIPNITGRRNWNYVKCIDINIIGDIPQKDLEKIRNIFNDGCTFWHNPSTFLDYSQNNSII